MSACTGCGVSISAVHKCELVEVFGHCRHYLDLTPEQCGECATDRQLATVTKERDEARNALVGFQEPWEWVLKNHPSVIDDMPWRLIERFDTASIALATDTGSSDGG